jgi:tRNA nucleotidyltransferase (CCA-adding enzyme)
LQPSTIAELVTVITADQFGRPPRPKVASEKVQALELRARELQVQSSPPEALLMGRHLIELGMQPGRDFGVILEAAYEAQLEGKFLNLLQAFRWLGAQDSLPLSETARRRLTAH